MYNSGLRVYLLDNYNWMDFTLLSLYLASYALRFLVDHWIKQSDRHFRATERARWALMSRNYTYYLDMEDELNVPTAYFTRACKSFSMFIHKCLQVDFQMLCFMKCRQRKRSFKKNLCNFDIFSQLGLTGSRMTLRSCLTCCSLSLT